MAANTQKLLEQLGLAGLIPFVGLAGLTWLLPGTEQPGALLAQAPTALATYAALIVSFLGGLHWGAIWLKLAEQTTPEVPMPAVGWGVMPSLLAWPGLFLPVAWSLWWMGALLLLCYVVDRKLFPLLGLQRWLRLRLWLSSVAALSCFVAAMALAPAPV